MSVKEDIIRAVDALPDDATLEDAIERLYLLYKVQRGIDQADAGEGVSQEEARKRMARWLQSSELDRVEIVTIHHGARLLVAGETLGLV